MVRTIRQYLIGKGSTTSISGRRKSRDFAARAVLPASTPVARPACDVWVDEPTRSALNEDRGHRGPSGSRYNSETANSQARPRICTRMTTLRAIHGVGASAPPGGR
jgi:hypothetical protein